MEIPVLDIQIIADAIGEHRGEVSCVGPEAWESRCDCKWTSVCFYDGTAEDDARWAHDSHLADEIHRALTAEDE